MKILGQLVDIHKRNVYPAAIWIKDGKIKSIEKLFFAPDVYIMPGLIDSHIHIESSMVNPRGIRYDCGKTWDMWSSLRSS